jgi:predicted dehydrogenase
VLSVLFVGLGGIGQRHLRNLRALLADEVHVMAVRSRGLQHVLTDQLTVEPGVLEERYGVEVVPSLEEALERRPDAVYVTNPSSLHIPVALAAARAGCHLFVEKPLSHSTEGVDELIAVAEAKGVVGLVAYQMRFHPAFKQVQSWLDAGAIGRVLAVRAEVGEYLPGFHAYEDYRQMYAARRDLGGGVVVTQIHEIDYLSALFGTPKRVFALGGHLSSLEVDVEDVASALLECRDRDGRLIPVHLHQDYVQRPPSRTCQIIGDEGKILWDFQPLQVKLFDGRGSLAATERWEGFPRNNLFLDELRHFLACLKGEEQPVVSLRDGANSLKVALAIQRSLEVGEAIMVE